MAESKYELFNMCPFVMVSVGGGGGILGVESESYIWTHIPCLGHNCRLWTYKIDENGKVYAEGCSLQFVGLTKEEIKKNFEIKNKVIEENRNR